jgi:hypothetical protein
MQNLLLFVNLTLTLEDASVEAGSIENPAAIRLSDLRRILLKSKVCFGSATAARK